VPPGAFGVRAGAITSAYSPGTPHHSGGVKRVRPLFDASADPLFFAPLGGGLHPDAPRCTVFEGPTENPTDVSATPL
jgi:hypothetical protein